MSAAFARIAPLDGLRGAAVMGILLMNIAAFALPQAAYVNPLADRGAGAADLAVWAIMFALVDGKMRAIFSILFGAGIVLVLRKAEEAGQDGASIHFRRMGALLAIGVLHFFLIWWGDILVLYEIGRASCRERV